MTNGVRPLAAMPDHRVAGRDVGVVDGAAPAVDVVLGPSDRRDDRRPDRRR